MIIGFSSVKYRKYLTSLSNTNVSFRLVKCDSGFSCLVSHQSPKSRLWRVQMFVFVLGWQAAGWRPAGVHQQRVSDRGDV